MLFYQSLSQPILEHCTLKNTEVRLKKIKRTEGIYKSKIRKGKKESLNDCSMTNEFIRLNNDNNISKTKLKNKKYQTENIYRKHAFSFFFFFFFLGNNAF